MKQPIFGISPGRIDELEWFWGAETSDPESEEWREELTEAEAALVASWDKAYSLGVKSMCERILQK